MSYMAGFNQGISSSTMTSGNGFNNITTQYIRTDQGIVKGNISLPQVIVSPKVTSDSAKEIETDAVTINIGGLTETAGRSNRQSTAGLTDLTGRSDWA